MQPSQCIPSNSHQFPTSHPFNAHQNLLMQHNQEMIVYPHLFIKQTLPAPKCLIKWIKLEILPHMTLTATDSSCTPNGMMTPQPTNDLFCATPSIYFLARKPASTKSSSTKLMIINQIFKLNPETITPAQLPTNPTPPTIRQHSTSQRTQPQHSHP